MRGGAAHHRTGQPTSIHAHGVDYTLQSDGTPHTGSYTPDGQERTYVFGARGPSERTDGTKDPGNAGYWQYHDHCGGGDHGTGGINASLFSALIVRRPGDPKPDVPPFVLVMIGQAFSLQTYPNTPTCKPGPVRKSDARRAPQAQEVRTPAQAGGQDQGLPPDRKRATGPPGVGRDPGHRPRARRPKDLQHPQPQDHGAEGALSALAPALGAGQNRLASRCRAHRSLFRRLGLRFYDSISPEGHSSHAREDEALRPSGGGIATLQRRALTSLRLAGAVALLMAFVGAAALAVQAEDRVRTVAHPRGAPVKPPNDPLFRFQWNLQAMQIPAAWAVSRGAGAVVAVLDTGVAYEDRGVYRRAPDLAGTRFVPGWDFVDGDAHPNDVPPRDRRSHGTQIAGIIAQTTDNGIGSAGVAPKAAIMPIRVLRPDLSGSATTIARGLRFAADHGADVANLSIAGPSGSRVLKAAIDYASSKGVTIVAAAGNDGRPAVGFPGAYPKVIAVGAVYQDRRRADYSNYGKALALVAPGGGEQGDARGYGPADGILAQTLKGGPSSFCYCFTASTSAAAAEVSGVAALLVASGRATAPSTVRSALLSSAQDLGPAGRDPQYGAGLVQASRALGINAAPVRHAFRSARQPWLTWFALALGAAALAGLVAVSRSWRSRRD